MNMQRLAKQQAQAKRREEFLAKFKGRYDGIFRTGLGRELRYYWHDDLGFDAARFSVDAMPTGSRVGKDFTSAFIERWGRQGLDLYREMAGLPPLYVTVREVCMAYPKFHLTLPFLPFKTETLDVFARRLAENAESGNLNDDHLVICILQAAKEASKSTRTPSGVIDRVALVDWLNQAGKVLDRLSSNLQHGWTWHEDGKETPKLPCCPHSTVKSVLRDLLGCCELNMDDMEPATVQVIERAWDVLEGDPGDISGASP